MPAKGQTCLTCAATCCHGVVGYQYTEEALANAKAEIERGEAEWSKRSPLSYSHKELLSFGMVEISLPDKGGNCPRLTEDGKCSRQHHKPRLCRTYWCHGRLWKPRIATGG